MVRKEALISSQTHTHTHKKRPKVIEDKTSCLLSVLVEEEAKQEGWSIPHQDLSVVPLLSLHLFVFLSCAHYQIDNSCEGIFACANSALEKAVWMNPSKDRT